MSDVSEEKSSEAKCMLDFNKQTEQEMKILSNINDTSLKAI